MNTTEQHVGVSGVDFVTVSTSDLDTSIEFYRDTLGLEQSKLWGSDVATAKGPVEREVTAAFAGGAIVLLLAGGALSLAWFGRPL